jgi:phenylalanyl-tRNA synthetase beta chain
VRVPLSWLGDFAPFEGDPADLAATLDDLGLVVEGTEVIGEGLGDVVVVRVVEIAPIQGADRIRRVVVDDGSGPVEVVCGAWNFEVGDLVPLAPVGSVLPGGFAIGKRKMKGVVSNGMLCSGRELGVSEDHEGILRLNDVAGAAPGVPLVTALGIEPDVVFDVAVEANRPDAWSMVGVARDLAARLGLPFSVPEPELPVVTGAADAVGEPGAVGAAGAVGDLATVRVDDLELCPRFTARVITGVEVGPSPEWLARRLVLAGMRPINNVVDASNYVMLELGQPTHPYDLDRLPGHGLLVRRAHPGETVTTLDGVQRTLGRPGPGLGDTGQDCLICDAEGSPVAIGGVMGGASSEIDDTTSRVLLEAAYFVPMAIARTAKRLALRTEASARFERGCDPAGIDRAAARFCQLLSLTAGPGMRVAEGAIDVRGDLPQPVVVDVRASRINALLGTTFTAPEVAGLLAPLGIEASTPPTDGDDLLSVTVPTFRPDIRPGPMGEADIAEEVARTYGYIRIARRTPSWPQPGRLTDRQRDRRLLKEVLCGLGCSEAWTATFVSEADQLASRADGPYVEVTNPLVDAERYLRTSMVAGLVRAVQRNAERRQSAIRFFEVGSAFRRRRGSEAAVSAGAGVAGDEAAGAGAGEAAGAGAGEAAGESSERMCVVLAADGDDSFTAVAAWRTIAEALGLASWSMGELSMAGQVAAPVHPFRSSALVSDAAGDAVVGVVGELDPTVVGRFDLVGPDGRPRRVGWLDLDLDVLLDRRRVPRRPERSRPLSRFPSSDIDLAFVVLDTIPAASVERTLRRTGGDLLESVDLFDVYRGGSLPEGSRSLAFHLRFCALDRTLTDDEVGGLRARCIEAVEGEHQASLR